FHAARHSRTKPLLSLGKFLLGQADSFSGNAHLLLGGGNVQHRLPGFGFNLIGQVALADLLNLEAGLLFLDPVLPPETIEDWHGEEELEVVAPGQPAKVSSAFPVAPVYSQAGQILVPNRAQVSPGGPGSGPFGSQLRAMLTGKAGSGLGLTRNTQRGDPERVSHLK